MSTRPESRVVPLSHPEDNALLRQAQEFIDRERHRPRDEAVALLAFIVAMGLLWIALKYAPMVGL
jgi:hypothetical protein